MIFLGFLRDYEASCKLISLHVDEIFSLLVIFLETDVAQSDTDQESYQAGHENAQVVDFLINVVVGTTCLEWKLKFMHRTCQA